MAKSELYKAAGVDIDLATTLLDRVKADLGSTRRPEMLTPIGGFGGLFQIDLTKYKEPVMVASIDGVGTKLMVAAMMEKYDTVGMDIVNHCINDISVQGAEPVYFLDYIGIGKLRSPLYEEVLSGIAKACKAAGCAVLGGETAEMPGMYGNDFDLVGVITGIVEKSKIITGEKIRPGHVAIGIASNGPHTNGFSLARKFCLTAVNTLLKLTSSRWERRSEKLCCIRTFVIIRRSVRRWMRDWLWMALLTLPAADFMIMYRAFCRQMFL